MPLAITLLSGVHAVVEVAGLMFLVRGILWLFGPRARQGNFFYDILSIGTTPFIKGTRAITPRFVRDAFVPTVAFALVFCLWLGVGVAKAVMCASQGLECAAIS